jgi:hypothetical protein
MLVDALCNDTLPGIVELGGSREDTARLLAEYLPGWSVSEADGLLTLAGAQCPDLVGALR